jgi:hypothetical protein
MTPNSRSRPPHPPFVISPRLCGMAPPLLIIIAIPILIVLAMSSTATASTTANPTSSPSQSSQASESGPINQVAKAQSAAQTSAQLPFQAAFASSGGQAISQPVRVDYQGKNPTSTMTPSTDYPPLTFTPDPNAPQIFITSQDASFFPNPDNSSCKFVVTTATPPAFTEPTRFPVINFNPELDPAGCGVPSPTPPYDMRPFTDLIPHTGGTPCATQIAADHLDATPTLQAGLTPGALYDFHAVFTGQIYVPVAGDVTLLFYVDDEWILGIGPRIGGSEQPSFVSGVYDPPRPPSPTPIPITTFKGYQVLTRYQVISGGDIGQREPTVLHFPSAGYYPIELDYTECNEQHLEMVLGSSAAVPIPNGPTPTGYCASAPYWCTKLSPNITPDANELSSVAAITNDNIWAVGDHQLNTTPASSLVEHWDGTNWSIVTVTPVGALRGIAKVLTEVPTQELWVVGDSGVLHATGATPTWVADNSITGMKAVAAQGPKDVYAVGTAIMHYTGPVNGWSGATPIPAGSTLNGVAVLLARTPVGNLTPTNTPIRVVWAVGGNGSIPVTMKQVGTSGAWSTVVPAATPTGSTISWLNSVDSFSATNVWAVGGYYVAGQNKTYSLTEHYDGSSWAVITSPSPGDFYNDLKSVFYNYEGDLWAVGSYSPDSYTADLHPLILRWTDTAWQQVDAPIIGADSDLLGVGTSSGAPNIPISTVGAGNPVYANSVWAVGRYQDSNGGTYNTLIESIIAPTATVYTTPQSTSHYEFDADPATHEKQGCDAAMHHDGGIIVLDYGRPVDACVGPQPCVNVYGSLPVPNSNGAYATVTVPQITNAAENFVIGYYNAFYNPSPDCPQATGTPRSIILAMGINNSKANPTGTATAIPPMKLTYGHAQAWATAVSAVQVFVQGRPTAIPMSVAAGVDFEPDFSNYDDTPTPGQTLTPNSPRAWATAYSGAGVSTYYDFGSTDGYPAPVPTDPTPPVPPFSCCSAWRTDQLYEISWSIPQARALPEIYQSQASRYWYAVKRWAAEHNEGMVFSGEMTECGKADCYTFEEALNWTQAWQILWLELNADERTGFQQNLDYSTDIWP